ncbi:MAG: glycosyltransferase family 4 protein [Candidatus Hydrogenedentes bacterium]|nr:glycosyltransferase family 4 protein [Candidatus Hydrogenedentota bacterium]
MARKPSILFLTLYPSSAASPRYRVEQFIPYLNDQGFQCTVASALTAKEYGAHLSPRRYHVIETRRRIGQLLCAQAYDIVFVQKAITTAYLRGMHALLRAMARRVVYDIDDAVHLAPPHPLGATWRAFEDAAQVTRMMRNADLVLAGNQWLVEQARQHARRVELFQTVVDTTRFVPARQTATELVIGWMGGSSTTPHLQAAAGLDKLEGVSLRCIGADPARVPWENAEKRPWSYEGEVAELQQFAIGVMPLLQDEWTRGKCALKALQYMACGIPCIATPFGAILDIGEHNQNVLFANSPGEWRAAIGQLRDPLERERIGAAGRATVERHYSLDKAAPRFAALLESVA